MNVMTSIPRQLMLLAVLVIGFHAWNLTGDYVYDDFIYIVMNPAVQAGLADWPRFFTDPSTYSWLPTSHYRPLVTLSYGVNTAMGMGILGFKLTQLMLHLATAGLFFWALTLIHRHYLPLRPGVPLLAAGLFGIMPFNVEAVHYMTARSAVMCGLFAAVALVLFLLMRRTDCWWKAGLLYLAHLLALGVALLSKETALTVPGALFLVDFLIISRGDWRAFTRLRFWWPYLPYLAGLAVAFAFMPNVHGTRIYLIQAFGIEWRLSAAIYCLVENIRLMLVPTGLTIAHPVSRSGTLSDPLTMGCLAVVTGLVLWALAMWRRQPLITVGLGWYFLLIAPSTFVHLKTILLENRGYSASFGIALVTAVLVAALWQRAVRWRPAMRGVLATGLAAVMVCYFVVAYQRQQVWASNLAMWEDAVAHDPTSDDAVLNLGARYTLAGRLDEAVAQYKVLMARRPDWISPRQNLARVYMMQGRYPQARELLAPMLDASPGDPDLLLAMAEVERALNRPMRAITLLQRGIDAEIKNLKSRFYIHEVVPGKYPEMLVDLALGVGRPDVALWAARRMADGFPGNSRVHLLWLKIHAYSGHWAEAERALNQLAQAMPDSPQIGQWRTQLHALQRAGAGQ